MLVKDNQLLATRLYFVILPLTSTALRLELIFMYLVHGCVSLSTFMTISPKLFSTHSLSKAIRPLPITGPCTYSEIGCSFARHFATDCQAMLVFWLAVCSEQVAIQISICYLSKLFLMLEYCELTAMESNITINCSFLESLQLKVLPNSDSWQSSDGVKSIFGWVLISWCSAFHVLSFLW